MTDSKSNTIDNTKNTDNSFNLKSEINSLSLKNSDLEKKIEILEETVNYYKQAFNDSQQAIQEVSEYSHKLRAENEELLKKISKLQQND